MNNRQAEGSEFVKKQMTDGYISPEMIQRALSIFLFVSLIFVGIASLVGLSGASIIGWDGLTLFWQRVFIGEAILIVAQLLLILFFRKETNLNQLILVIGYLVFSIKLGLDLFLMIAMFLMDRDLFESWKYIYFSIIAFGLVVLIVGIYQARKMNIRKYRETYFDDSENEEEGSVKNSKFKVLILTIFPLTLITGFIFRENFLSLGGEMVFIMFIAIIVYYGLIINAILPVYGIYFWFKYPSYRIESNEKLTSVKNVTNKKMQQKKGRKQKQ